MSSGETSEPQRGREPRRTPGDPAGPCTRTATSTETWCQHPQPKLLPMRESGWAERPRRVLALPSFSFVCPHRSGDLSDVLFYIFIFLSLAVFASFLSFAFCPSLYFLISRSFFFFFFLPFSFCLSVSFFPSFILISFCLSCSTFYLSVSISW